MATEYLWKFQFNKEAEMNSTTNNQQISKIRRSNPSQKPHIEYQNHIYQNIHSRLP